MVGRAHLLFLLLSCHGRPLVCGPGVWLPLKGKCGLAKLFYVDARLMGGYRLRSVERRSQPVSCPSHGIILFLVALWLGCTKIC